MSSGVQDSFRVAPEFQPYVRAAELTAEAIFTSPRIKVWRSLPDREDCTLDFDFEGKPVRWHVKRYPRSLNSLTPAEVEFNGAAMLTNAGIATAAVVGWGILGDRRSFIIFRDLDGFMPGDKMVLTRGNFDRLLVPTADLAAKLHNANLHHRDLYLCHFMAKDSPDGVELSLIDTARVAPLRSFFTRGRWIVKDVAQFWYSLTRLPITAEQREAWIKRYAEQRGLPGCESIKRAMLGKVGRIARHDKSLNQKQPTRNISIPEHPLSSSPAVQEHVRTQ